MKNMLKDAAILFVITLVAGLVLGFVYQITKEPIALAEEKAEKEAYMEVFPDAANFTEIAVCPAEDSDFEGMWTQAGYGGVSVDKVLTADAADGSSLGYVLMMTGHEGYGGDITFSMGIRNDGTVNGISILSISETPGLGMNAEEVLKPQYAGKQVAEFTVTKTGATMDSEIDAISGATITSKAITSAVNGGLYYFQNQLGGGASEAK